MKKSNILLLGGFLTLLLFITAIHITLYAKYKAGDFTIYNAEDDLISQSMQSFPNILFVSVRNVPVGTVRFSDVAQVEKGKNEDIQYTRKGDTLQITGKPSPQGFTSPVAFNLPYNATLSVFNSSLSFVTGKKMPQNSPVIYLQKSHAIFHGEQSPLQLGDLRVVASDNSNVAFHGNTSINHLEVELSNSSIESSEVNFGQLSIATDSLSRISLPAKDLLKATIKTIVPK